MGKSKKLRKIIKDAKMGKPYAQYQLGLRFQTGCEVIQDMHRAAMWMMLAAESEYPPAKEWICDYSFDDDANVQSSS